MPLNEKGEEVLDPTPVAKPLGWRAPYTIQEQIQRFVRDELSRRAAQDGFETFEEAEDFNVGDDYDPRSPHEIDEDLPAWREEDQVKEAVRHAEERIAKRFLPKRSSPERSEEAPSAGAGAPGKP